MVLRKQGITDFKRITIRKGGEEIKINTYILTFNWLKIPKEVKIRYCLERVEQYIPAPLRCFKCQKYRHHRKSCRGHRTCTRCGEKTPTAQRKIAQIKLNAQTVSKTIPLSQDLVTFIKKRGKYYR